MNRPRVIVVGGGLAGLMSAVKIAENGGQAAVLLRDRAQANLQGNVFYRNKGYGVDVAPPFYGKINGSGNSFRENRGGAVRLAELNFLGE